MEKKIKENRLVVANAGWAETLPDWLKEEVKAERMTLGLVANIKPIEEVGNAEVAVYLYTASLTAPMSQEMNNVYIYLTSKLMKKKNEGGELPDFMENKLKSGLTPDEDRELHDLKRDLYRKRGGEIHHPLLDAMRQFGKGIPKKE